MESVDILVDTQLTKDIGSVVTWTYALSARCITLLEPVLQRNQVSRWQIDRDLWLRELHWL